MTGAEAIAAILEKQGAEYLFTYPDQRLVEPAAALGIRPLMPRTERAAVAMADGYARMTNGRAPAVVAVQYGPGIESSFGGVAQAFSDSTPMLILCGHTPLARVGQDPNFDAVLNFRGITKWAVRAERAARLPEVLRRAFTYMQAGQPGPVLIDLPLEAVLGEVDEAEVAAYAPVRRIRSSGDPADVDAAAGALLTARRPVIHAGHGTLYAEASDLLRELAELIGAPVMTTLAGKSCFPEDHPLSLGAGSLTWPRPLARHLEDADLILAVGASLTASQFAVPIPPGKTVIQIVNDERNLNKDYPTALPILGDVRLVLAQLISAVADGNGLDERQALREDVEAEISRQRAAFHDDWRARARSNEVPLSPYRIMAELDQALRGTSLVVTHDSGRPRDQLAPFWTSIDPRSYLGWGKSTQLGHGLGLIMGAKLAAPERTAINFMGDAAFGMVGMELESAVRLRIPVMTVVLNNSAMSNYEKIYPIAAERFGFKFLSGDYGAVASALGAHAERVAQPDEILPALRRSLDMLATGRPVLFEAITKEEGAVAQDRFSDIVPKWAQVAVS